MVLIAFSVGEEKLWQFDDLLLTECLLCLLSLMVMIVILIGGENFDNSSIFFLL